MEKNFHILVIGAGVIGLTTAVTLLERGFKVTIYAKTLSPNNCSDIGCAMWEPYSSEPWERIEGWSKYSLYKFRELTKDLKSGVSFRSGFYLSKYPIEKPKWAFDDEIGIKFFDKNNDPRDILKKSIHDYYDYAMEYKVPCIDPTIFNPWILKKFFKLGGQLKMKNIKKFTKKLFEPFDAIANCCGLGALELCPNDKETYPRRGQLIQMVLPNCQNFYADLDFEEGGYTGYIIPRTNYVCLGGTTQFNNSNKNVSFIDQKKNY